MELLLHRFVFDRRWRVLRHTFFWTFMYLDEILSYVGLTPPLEEPFILLILEFMLDVVLVYVNIYVFLPRLFWRKKYVVYFLLTGLMLLSFNAINFWAEAQYFEFEEFNLISMHFSSSLMTLSVLATAVAIKLGKTMIEERQLREEIQKERIQTELTYLKQQVNPHFLFNVLNSLYIQSQTSPKSVSKTVMQLSDLLRYQIYEATEKEKIPLKREMDFLKNYLDLEKMRRDDLSITWKIGGDSGNLPIEPLIFLPLVENAVKHSKTSKEQSSFIHVNWTIKNHSVKIDITNSLSSDNDQNKGGFGIENLRKRLDLTYPGRYLLVLQPKRDSYHSSLTIQVDEKYNY